MLWLSLDGLGLGGQGIQCLSAITKQRLAVGLCRDGGMVWNSQRAGRSSLRGLGSSRRMFKGRGATLGKYVHIIAVISLLYFPPGTPFTGTQLKTSPYSSSA